MANENLEESRIEISESFPSHFHDILKEIGEQADREGLAKTPERSDFTSIQERIKAHTKTRSYTKRS